MLYERVSLGVAPAPFILAVQDRQVARLLKPRHKVGEVEHAALAVKPGIDLAILRKLEASTADESGARQIRTSDRW